MPIIATARTAAELDAITHAVYGWYMRPTDISQVVPGELRITVTLPSGTDALIPTRFLRVRSVRSYEYQAAPGVTVHDIAAIRYDASRNRLTITSPIPVRFTIDVDAIDVDVVEPEPG